MTGLPGGLLLLSVPGLPLLLVLPALRSRLRWPCHLALLPAVGLLLVPGAFAIDLPWLLFGSGLGIDGASRWLLAMSVTVWATAATLLNVATGKKAGNRPTTFFLLTMAGNLGAILTTELVGFLAYTALMGYGFYGLLVEPGDETARRAGRIYLGLLILADLVLFDALLIVAATTDALSFAQVRHALAQSPSIGWYPVLVLVGFALKAGIWPLHLWLPLAFASARPAVAVLLGSVPVATGLVGMVRWLPLGEVTLPDLRLMGLIVQGVGVAAILYALVVGAKRARLKQLPAYAAITATGVFAIGLGAGLADPAAWNRYQFVVPVFIASLGLGLAVLTTVIGWRAQYPGRLARPTNKSSLWFERWAGIVVRWAKPMVFDRVQHLRTSLPAKAGRLRQIHGWQQMLDAGEHSLQRWPLAITVFVLLAVVITSIAALAGASAPG